MAVAWNQRYSVGHPHIDAQHQQLLEHYNRFSEACGKGKGRDEIMRLFGFLDNYVREHFAAEEKLMAQNAYPRAEAHRQRHGELTRALLRMKNQLRGDQAPITVVIEAGQTLIKWVLEHIGQEDVALGRHLA